MDPATTFVWVYRRGGTRRADALRHTPMAVAAAGAAGAVGMFVLATAVATLLALTLATPAAATTTTPAPVATERFIPCYDEDRSMFLSNFDMQCHFLDECGYTGVDVAAMVQFNEDNPDAPAQPCRCRNPERRAPPGVTDAGMPTCGQTCADRTTCPTIAAGPGQHLYCRYRDDQPECHPFGAFTGFTIDSVPEDWLSPLGNQFEDMLVSAITPLGSQQGVDWDVGAIFDLCGPTVDIVHFENSVQCTCMPHTDWSWDETSLQEVPCRGCERGYYLAWGNKGTRVCHAAKYTCDDYDHAPLQDTDPDRPNQVLCANPDDYCQSLADDGHVDLHATQAAGSCVCAPPFGSPTFDAATARPCDGCNNRDGYYFFDVSPGFVSPGCRHLVDNPRGVANVAPPRYTDGVAGHSIFHPNSHVTFHLDRFFGQYNYDRDDVNWAVPAPPPGFITTDLFDPYDDDDRVALLAFFASPHAAERRQFAHYMCGQAADLDASAASWTDDHPTVECKCVAHARRRIAGSPDFCVCDEGYVFDAPARTCRAAATHCGPGGDPDNPFGCRCTAGVTLDPLTGRCDVCGAGAFRAIDFCPDATQWCADATATPLLGPGLGFDLAASIEADNCVCSAQYQPFAHDPENPGCHTCVTAGHIPDLATGDCASVAVVCANAANHNRLDEAASLAAQACVCLGAFRNPVANPQADSCSLIPDDHYLIAATDVILHVDVCGPGADGPATTVAGFCVCSTDRRWQQTAPLIYTDACHTCEGGFIPMAVDAATGVCPSVSNLCGPLADTDASNDGRSCVCDTANGALHIFDQPGPRCSDCDVDAGWTRSRTADACTRTADIFPVGIEPPSPDLFDAAFAFGQEEAVHPGSCGIRWTTTPTSASETHMDAPVALFTPFSHAVDDARADCEAYFPCSGFYAFLHQTVGNVGYYRFVYFTRHPSFQHNATANAFDPLDMPLGLVAVHHIHRLAHTACDGDGIHGGLLLDPVWYWETWARRLDASALPPIAFPEATQELTYNITDGPAPVAREWDNSVELAITYPEAVQHHFFWVGHTARLWPNVQCRLSPTRATAATGCRAQTCPTLSHCPADFRVDRRDDNLCLATGTDGGDDPAQLNTTAAYRLSTLALLPDAHPLPCAAIGLCTFDVDADRVDTRCLCQSGVPAPPTDRACTAIAADAGVHDDDDDDTSCWYPLPHGTNNTQWDTCAHVGDDAPTADAPCPGLLVGPACTTLDADRHCFADGDTAPCSGRGACHVPTLESRDMSEVPACVCEEGWAGPYCGTRLCVADCGPFGACVVDALGSGAHTCVCARRERHTHGYDHTPSIPFLAEANADGRCTIDLCMNPEEGRWGSLVMLTDVVLPGANGVAPVTRIRRDIDATPVGRCHCLPTESGARNTGVFCDTHVCPNDCGIDVGDAGTALVDTVCASCAHAHVRQRDARCGDNSIGGVCDCAGVVTPYWAQATATHRYVTANASLASTHALAACGPYCEPPAAWSGAEQRCICQPGTNRMGARCDQVACEHGAPSADTNQCVSCDPGWRLNTDDPQRLPHCVACIDGYDPGASPPCSNCLEADGYGRFDPPASLLQTHDAAPTCRTCDDDYVRTTSCHYPGTADLLCSTATDPVTGVATLQVDLCACIQGHTGLRCDFCAVGYWSPGPDYPCRPVLGSAGNATGRPDPDTPCHPDPAHTATATSAVALVGTPPQCVCAPGYAPPDCRTCDENHFYHNATDVCVSCADTIGCDPVGSTGALCLNPAALGITHVTTFVRGAYVQTPVANNGAANLCFCDPDTGRGGPTCAACSTELKYAAILNSRPLACHRCDQDCGANGELMCGINLAVCNCKAHWFGTRCNQCARCGLGGRCATAAEMLAQTAQHAIDVPNATYFQPDWCICDADRGFDYDPAARRLSDGYKAPCTDCAPGYFLQGILCRPLVDTCGLGADADATRTHRTCVCDGAYLPIDQQPTGRCVQCADAHVATRDGLCTTCSTPCGPNTHCAWDATNARLACQCNDGFTGPTCAACTLGHVGPLCTACHTHCATSGGVCAWDTGLVSPVCICPPTTINTLRGNLDTPCRPCAPTIETDTHCLSCPTCPANSVCAEEPGTNTTVRCACRRGYTRPPGTHTLYAPCVLEGVYQDQQTLSTTTLFDSFDSLTLLALCGLAGTLSTLVAVCMLFLGGRPQLRRTALALALCCFIRSKSRPQAQRRPRTHRRRQPPKARTPAAL